MLDHPEVTRLTAEMGYPEVAVWLATTGANTRPSS